MAIPFYFVQLRIGKYGILATTVYYLGTHIGMHYHHF
jgi:hypothetical protein